MRRILHETQNAEHILQLVSEPLLLIDKEGICIDAYNINNIGFFNEISIGKNIATLFPTELSNKLSYFINQTVTSLKKTEFKFHLYLDEQTSFMNCQIFPYESMALCKFVFQTESCSNHNNISDSLQKIDELYDVANICQWTYDTSSKTIHYMGDSELRHSKNPITLTLDRFIDLVVNDDLPVLMEWIKQIERFGMDYAIGVRVLLNDSIYYIKIQTRHHIKQPDGSYIVEGYIQNVTDIQRQRNDINTLTHAINNTKQSIYAAKEDGSIIFANRNFKQFYNISNQQDLGTIKVFDLLQEIPNLEAWKEKYNTVKSGEYVEYTVFNPIIHHKDILALEYTMYHVTSDNGENSYWVFSHDISERLRYESQIKQLNRIMDTVIDNLPAGIVVKDINNGFSYTYRNNESNNRNFHIPKEAIGKNDFDFFTEEIAKRKLEEDIEIATTGKSSHKVVEQRDKNGKPIILDKRKIKVESNDFSPIIICIEWDITQMEMMRRELEVAKVKAETSDKLKSAFLANMSHEIRTPLNAIIGFSRIIAECDDAEERKSYYDIIETNNEHLLKLINEILDLSKIESGIMTFSNNPIRLHKLCEDIHNAHSLRLPEKVKLFFEDSDADLIIESDKNRLFQVISNLIGNAIKFTSKGSISFGYKVHESNVVFHVQDTGTGIPENKLKDVFERFVKLDTMVQGTGLGLSICKTIIERLGGSISVTSKLGEGTRFFFNIPLSRKKAEELSGVTEIATPITLFHSSDSHAEKSSSDLTNSEFNEENIKDVEQVGINKVNIIPNVLVVEDQEANYKLLELMLSKNYKVFCARNGVEAVALYDEVKPDVILMDIRMPELDGIEAANIIRQLSNTIPIIAQSAFDSKENVKAALDAGCNDFISKPLTKEKLESVLKKYL